MRSTRLILTSIVLVALALGGVPARVRAQHSAGGAPSIGTAVPAGSAGGDGSSSSSAPAVDSGGSSSSSGSSSSPRSGHAYPPQNTRPAGVAMNSAIARSEYAATGNRAAAGGVQSSSVVPQFSRPRNDRPIVGYAVARPPATSIGSGVEVTGSFIPLGYGYGYDGYGYAGAALFGYYDPFDPFAISYLGPALFAGDSFASVTTSRSSEQGALRLKVKPVKAEIYVDNARAGRVSDFSFFHRLHLDAGVHRIELRAPGYEPLVVNVRIEPGATATYQGTLDKSPR